MTCTHASLIGKLRIQIAIAVICVLLLTPVAQAADLNEAGAIIDYGDGSTSYVWVPFGESEITAFELLQRSELDLVSVGFGGLGEAICQIGPTGCGIDSCRTRLCQTNSSSPFWRIYILDGDTWRFAGNGVSGTNVGDGDIVALSWGSDTPDLPVINIEQLAANAGANPDAIEPRPALATDGKVEPDDTSASWAPSAVILGIVVLASGFLVYRSRNQQQVAA